MSGERPDGTPVDPSPVDPSPVDLSPADPGLVVAPQGPVETEIDPALEPTRPHDDPPASEAEARSATTGLLGSSAVMATGRSSMPCWPSSRRSRRLARLGIGAWPAPN